MKRKTNNDEAIRLEKLHELNQIRKRRDDGEEKVKALLRMTRDYNDKKCQEIMSQYQVVFDHRVISDRIANSLLCVVDEWLQSAIPFTMRDIDMEIHEILRSNSFLKSIYNLPSFKGDYNREKECYYLPDEFKGKDFQYVELIVDDIDILKETFCNKDKRYKRAYNIMDQLDSNVVAWSETSEYPEWPLIGFGAGEVLFHFSHFEIDLREPDESSRALYVVYEFFDLL